MHPNGCFEFEMANKVPQNSYSLNLRQMKGYVVYRNPQNYYESFVERFCLREKAKTLIVKNEPWLKRQRNYGKKSFLQTKRT